MDIQKSPKPQDMKIFVPRVGPNRQLSDNRKVQRYGQMNFGTISQVARNLGIKMEISDEGLTFSAPRARLQMFAEKLHFSLIRFHQIS